VQVHCDEGVAIRIGPEPCAGIREGVGEASVGERVGQPRNKLSSGCRRRLLGGRPCGWTRQRERASDPARSETLACMDALCTETGRSGVHPDGGNTAGSHREGEEP
jgi:hypothetical protein